MIARLLYGFIALLIGTSLIGPLAVLVNTAANPCPTAPYTNFSDGLCNNGTASVNTTTSGLYASASWGASILQMVPGFYAIALLCVAIALCMSALRDAGIA